MSCHTIPSLTVSYHTYTGQPTSRPTRIPTSHPTYYASQTVTVETAIDGVLLSDALVGGSFQTNNISISFLVNVGGAGCVVFIDILLLTHSIHDHNRVTVTYTSHRGILFLSSLH